MRVIKIGCRLLRLTQQVVADAPEHIGANQVSGTEAIQLVRQGQQLQCPVCSAVIKTVPEKWAPGIPLHGIECPNGQKHFMIHCEDENAMKEMRARMKARSEKASGT